MERFTRRETFAALQNSSLHSMWSADAAHGSRCHADHSNIASAAAAPHHVALATVGPHHVCHAVAAAPPNAGTLLRALEHDLAKQQSEDLTTNMFHAALQRDLASQQAAAAGKSACNGKGNSKSKNGKGNGIKKTIAKQPQELGKWYTRTQALAEAVIQGKHSEARRLATLWYK